MRNLRCIEHLSLSGLSHITSVCWDPAKDEVLCTDGPTDDGAIRLLRIVKQDVLTARTVASWVHQSPSPDLAHDRVVCSRHFGDNLTTCLIFEGGELCLIRESEDTFDPDHAHIEIVGEVDAGISAATWSPDEEVLVIATKAETVLFMSRDLNPITDIALSSEDLNISKHVSVGWGKKETQFQGKGAKALRDPTIPERVHEGTLSQFDDGSTTISWRGDGAYVAINSVEGGKRRVIRVYSRNGALDGVSEPVDGLEGSLSWRPEGNLIAGIQRFSDRLDVVFFERNGLRHGEFTLRLPAGCSLDGLSAKLYWNSDSTVLAVAAGGAVQLWTKGNDLWYLKQEVLCAAHNQACWLAWHPEKALRFVSVTTDRLYTNEYVFTVARGPVIPPHDHGVVAVVDGKMLKITPFRTANVPPPMALLTVAAHRTIVDVAFNSDNSIMTVLHEGGIDVYPWTLSDRGDFAPTNKAPPQISFNDWNIDGRPLQIYCFGKSKVAVLTSDRETSLLIVDGIGSSDGPNVVFNERIPLTSTIHSDGTQDATVLGQNQSGQLVHLWGSPSSPVTLGAPIQLPWCDLIQIEENMVLFGLSRNGHLYADSRLLARNCTSYMVTSSHLIFTTSSHLLKFVHLAASEDLELPPDDPEKDERCRNIERGALLVTVMPTNMSLLLQMPRGNLETIFPRAMVVAGIRELIDTKNYGRAFTYCRTQRVDMNILYDHHPEQFLSSVGLFLDQLDRLKPVTYIDLFLSSLKDEDVTRTTYKDTKRLLGGSSSPPQIQLLSGTIIEHPSSKVNKVCDAVLEALKARKGEDVQNIITAHVCKLPPALEDGLTLVAQLMQQDEAIAEAAVEHICFLVDVNKVYDYALGLYDLDLTLLVAQQSQRDPREYIPFIQNLHTLPELQRKFEIDDHLGRREKALAHLKSIGDFDTAKSYTSKHTLYEDALKLYRYDTSRCNALTDLYAAFLESKSKFREAGLAYESLGNYAKAANCYRAAGASCWRECLFAAQLQAPALSAEALSELATSLADALVEAKDYTGSATISLEYLSSLESAIRQLCKGYHFGDAMRLAALHKRPDLLPSALDAGLVDAMGSSTEFLADCKAQLRAQVPRIAELRRRAAEDPLAFYEGERPGGDLPDDVSVAASSRLSTSASLFTRYTGRDGASAGTAGTGASRATSRNRRREEKKRARGRKGTVYEEEYLVNSVRRLVERVEGARAEVERLVAALVRRNMAERARAVEALMVEVIGLCRAAIAEVFPAPAAAVADPVEDGVRDGEVAAAVAAGGLGVLRDFEEARTRTAEPPVVKDLQRLSLLGS